MTKSTLVVIAAALAIASCRRTDAPPVRPASAPHVATATAAGPVKDLRRANIDVKVDPTLPEATFLDSAAIGSKVGADGTVANHATTFKKDDPLFLTMRFKESPLGLQSSVLVFNSGKKQVGQEFRQMNSAKVVTFRIPPLKPGRYEIDGYWGGNLACQYAVAVK